jgi:hypothetical protein
MFRAFPDKTLTMKNDKCFGRKIPKQRLTVVLCSNMLGGFEKPLIIGNARNPRCFKGVRLENLNMTWQANKNAWMTTDIMIEWLNVLNRKMKNLNRKVALFLDNATCHPDIKLTNIQLPFLPPNTSSVCQPLDLGVIKSLKPSTARNDSGTYWPTWIMHPARSS